MSQWSKSQDYRNAGLEGTESVADGDWSLDERQTEPLKTVRCVIDKDYELRRFGSGDGAGTQATPALRRESTRVVCPVDSIRLRNHLEWKKQKEVEYLRKREAERLEEERRKDEKLREEKEKRRREKEREEKIREWQEQKAREKEERRREEMVMKALEQEIKGVTQTLDKEKLIHEWIRLKNKQKQIEAEKKAELMKREEETRALRQSLAEVSYRQWKERTKNRRITLPKNGYQIFGPKPVPVVKEDWNHDFAKGDADDRGTTARTPKSTVSMTLMRGLSNHDLGKRSPSSSHLKAVGSRTTVNDFGGVRSEMTLSIEKTPEEPGASRRLLHERARDGQKPVPKLKLFNLETLPTKSKLDIYLQPTGSDIHDSIAEEKPRKLKKPEDTLKKYLQGLSDVNTKLLVNLNEKLSSNQNGRERNVEKGQTVPGQSSRRSRSYDKPSRKVTGTRSSSLSTTDKSKKADDGRKAKRMAKPEGKEKRKPRKSCKPEVTEVSPYVGRKKTRSGKRD